VQQPHSNTHTHMRMRSPSTHISSHAHTSVFTLARFGKMHTGFKSMNHLGHRNGFETNVGSLQTGGAYSGPQHTTRWQDEHPIWNDQQFTNKPPFCAGARAHPAAASAYTQVEPQCSAADWHNNTLMQSGHLLLFSKVGTPGECCSECSNTSGCTHWVFQPDQISAGTPCHIKAGDAIFKPTGDTNHSVCGKAAGPPPGPPASAACTDEYSTDVWGQLAVQATEQHNTSTDGQLYVHLCFEGG
jgi:hypothetical protein